MGDDMAGSVSKAKSSSRRRTYCQPSAGRTCPVIPLDESQAELGSGKKSRAFFFFFFFFFTYTRLVLVDTRLRILKEAPDAGATLSKQFSPPVLPHATRQKPGDKSNLSSNAGPDHATSPGSGVKARSWFELVSGHDALCAQQTAAGHGG
ncbi:hypothetical protein IWZ03DRAFT_236431 [Phyllosticta citriasiana]|uniref:Uncharacterized protein n=1 Tax=Phyllosticta citriasiana TaxID=595635 RepID=A0ABR1KFI6_9PEZI